MYLYFLRFLQQTVINIGAFAKRRKATITFVISMCMSDCLYATTQLRLEGRSWNLICQIFGNLSKKI